MSCFFSSFLSLFEFCGFPNEQKEEAAAKDKKEEEEEEEQEQEQEQDEAPTEHQTQ